LEQRDQTVGQQNIANKDSDCCFVIKIALDLSRIDMGLMGIKKVTPNLLSLSEKLINSAS